MKRIGTAIWMGLWITLMVWGAWWLVREGWWMMQRDWIFTGFAVILVGLLIMVVSGRGIMLVLALLAGQTTPRLAKRDFRNSLANLAMFAKTGLWKE